MRPARPLWCYTDKLPGRLPIIRSGRTVPPAAFCGHRPTAAKRPQCPADAILKHTADSFCSRGGSFPERHQAMHCAFADADHRGNLFRGEKGTRRRGTSRRFGRLLDWRWWCLWWLDWGWWNRGWIAHSHRYGQRYVFHVLVLLIGLGSIAALLPLLHRAAICHPFLEHGRIEQSSLAQVYHYSPPATPLGSASALSKGPLIDSKVRPPPGGSRCALGTGGGVGGTGGAGGSLTAAATTSGRGIPGGNGTLQPTDNVRFFRVLVIVLSFVRVVDIVARRRRVAGRFGAAGAGW